MNKQSFVEVDSEVLAKACQLGLKSIKEMREQRLEKLIDEMMSKRFFKPKSREDALKSLKEDCERTTSMLRLSQYEMIMCRGGYYERLYKNLEGMSKLSDKVYLSRSDYDDISEEIGEVLSNE